jgi:hypothetical protein
MRQTVFVIVDDFRVFESCYPPAIYRVDVEIHGNKIESHDKCRKPYFIMSCIRIISKGFFFLDVLFIKLLLFSQQNIRFRLVSFHGSLDIRGSRAVSLLAPLQNCSD